MDYKRRTIPPPADPPGGPDAVSGKRSPAILQLTGVVNQTSAAIQRQLNDRFDRLEAPIKELLAGGP